MSPADETVTVPVMVTPMNVTAPTREALMDEGARMSMLRVPSTPAGQSEWLAGFGFCGSVRATSSISISNPTPSMVFNLNLQTKLGVLGQLGVTGTVSPTCFAVGGSLSSGVGGTMISNIIFALKDTIANLVAQGNLIVKR